MHYLFIIYSFFYHLIFLFITVDTLDIWTSLSSNLMLSTVSTQFASYVTVEPTLVLIHNQTTVCTEQLVVCYVEKKLLRVTLDLEE